MAEKSSGKRKEFLPQQERVWFSLRDGRGYRLGRIVELSEAGPIVQTDGHDQELVTVSYDSVYPAVPDSNKEVEDNCSLVFLNEATFLHNINLRYHKDKIYSYIANILIAVNPYKEISDLYSKKTTKEYMGKSLGVKPPHVYAIADKAYRMMRAEKLSQSIIISGESGAGKTESAKYILQYLCDNYGQQDGKLEEKILQANPILESFGNAKTARNNNSSRFGKFIEIHFDPRFSVGGGYISHYLLERARVVGQNNDERNFHIFYQMCAGASTEIKAALKLGSAEEYRYLTGGVNADTSAQRTPFQRSQSKAQEDCQEFSNLELELDKFGFDGEEKMNVYTALAIVLHLGNITFQDANEDTSGGCQVLESSEASLATAAALLQIDPDHLRTAITTRITRSKSRNEETVIEVPLKPVEAASARDALSKSVYARLFDYIVSRINHSIPFQKETSKYYIGVLDIAGFEYFTVNSFEQFCINYCNEKLQQFFNQRILKDEQNLYLREGLNVEAVTFVDNQDCIDLVDMKDGGIISLLDEESKLPTPNFTNFTSQVHTKNSSHFRLAFPRKSKLKEHRELRDDEGFLIRHFAGAVCYQTRHFIEKNNDALHGSLEGIMLESGNSLIKQLFTSNAGDTSARRGKLNFLSVGSKFKIQLDELLGKLKNTCTSFIRCIKPNSKMIALDFESESVLSQLNCAGMTSVLELMQRGYPCRIMFSELYSMYKQYLPPRISSLDPRLFCKALFKALGLCEKEFQFGQTKVFFKPGKFAEFDQIVRSDPENLRILVAKVEKWLIRSRWRKMQYGVLEAIKLRNKIIYRRNALIYIQSRVRTLVARRKYYPRIQGTLLLKSNIGKVDQIRALANSLDGGKQFALDAADKLTAEANQSIIRIRTAPVISRSEIENINYAFIKDINAMVRTAQSMIEKEAESKRLAELDRINREIEEQKRRVQEQKEEEARREQERLQRLEIERRRQEEERVEAEKNKEVQQIQEKTRAPLERKLLDAEEKMAQLQAQLEQERRDHELALRLLAESKAGMDESTPGSVPPPPSKSPTSPLSTEKTATAPKKFNLSKWKYAELRDTINTSCDIDLLEACREEFHRRIKVYHAWKAKNKNKFGYSEGNMRAPANILNRSNSKDSPTIETSIESRTEQRYFRIPFLRNSSNHVEAGQNKGWWYAHFDGPWISRQMEVHEGVKTILLEAGVDDMNMCELRLEETGLTKKRGAEILESDFEREWIKNGGNPPRAKKQT